MTPTRTPAAPLKPRDSSSEPSQQSVRITVPLIPPSVNHYKMRTRKGVTFVSHEAKAFKDAVIIFARQANADLLLDWNCLPESRLRKIRYELEARVYFGKDQKGDGDNLWKCIADGLKEARVIHSDAAVSDWIMRVRRDWGAPRTEITVTILEGK